MSPELGTSRTSRDVRLESTKRLKADIDRPLSPFAISSWCDEAGARPSSPAGTRDALLCPFLPDWRYSGRQAGKFDRWEIGPPQRGCNAADFVVVDEVAARRSKQRAQGAGDGRTREDGDRAEAVGFRRGAPEKLNRVRKAPRCR
jgi:hypothetical protein